jgi:uncharacterized protein YdeI (YjbR/CyaY-like superfamily)
MAKQDPRVDAYIAKSADFAKPILTHLRKLVHTAVPDIEEDMKWSFPHFMHHGMVCSMASFKSHCAFGFWKASLVLGDNGEAGAMGHFGRITSLADLPPDKKIIGYVKKAARLNEEGVKVPKKPAAPRVALKVPGYFTAALGKHKQARATFENLSYSQKKEYVEWVTEAKTDATRQKRLETAVAWIAEGKSRNWKYT